MTNMFERMRYGLQRFMYGRNGSDQFSWALVLMGVLLCVISSLTDIGLLYVVGYVPLVFAIYRMYSRNLEKRHQENVRFLNLFTRLKDRQNRYFSCPSCRQMLRVPRGKGRINIRCHKCGRQFIRKTYTKIGKPVPRDGPTLSRRTGIPA